MAKVGRPSQFTNLDKIKFKKLVVSGWDDAQISDFFGVAVSTLTRWKQKNKEFCTALKDWKKEADLKVEKSLYERACGYSHPAVKFFQCGKKIISQPYIERYPPDATSMIFWLKNRQPDKWRDKTDVDLGLSENLVEKLKDVSAAELITKANALIGKPTSPK